MSIRVPQFLARVIARIFHLPAPPLSLTVAGAIVRFSRAQLTPSMERHERAHIAQAARRAPRWLPEWLRPWVGAPAYWIAYARAHRRHGYERNPYEVEARIVAGEP